LKTKSFIDLPFIKTLVYANVFVAFCSLAQVFFTYQLFPIPVNFANNSYLVFILLSTYLQYNVQRGYMINPSNAHTERSQWLLKHKKIMLENDLLTPHSVWYLVSQFCFISVLCLLFDIKDLEQDYMTGVNTYANKFGITITKLICVCSVIIAFTCFYNFKHDTNSIIASLLLRLLIIGTILFTSDKRHSFYYYLWVDGLMIMQMVLFFIF